MTHVRYILPYKLKISYMQIIMKIIKLTFMKIMCEILQINFIKKWKIKR